jgi:transposase InsO family protein
MRVEIIVRWITSLLLDDGLTFILPSIMPWHDAVDLIGPWTLPVNGKKLTFRALTIIGTVTNLEEVVRLSNKTSAHIALQFENTWLSRYPRLLNCLHDPGSEFIGDTFKRMLLRNGIRCQQTTPKNPQGNSICEQMHQAIGGNTLRALSLLNPPAWIEDAHHQLDTAIANAVYATRCAYNSALRTTPGGLAFGGRDMILNISHWSPT